jgi:hypothetical protein
MRIYGAVSVRGQEFFDDEIAEISPDQRLLYGTDWKYLGDQGFEESNIAVSPACILFGGRGGLRNFLEWYHRQEAE